MYTSDKKSTAQKLEVFSKINLPSLSEDDQRLLGRPIREQEIFEALTQMKNGECPGPDGFPVKWFQACKSKIVTLLEKVFNHSFKLTHLLSETMSVANIFLHPEKGQGSR